MEEKKSSKVGIFILVSFILLVMMVVLGYYVYQLKQDNKYMKSQIETLQTRADVLSNVVEKSQVKEDNTINEVSTNAVVNNTVETTANSKYDQLTESIAKNFKRTNGDVGDGDEYFVAQEIINNNDGTHTIKGRIYQYVDLRNTSLSEEQYQELLTSKKIKLFDVDYSLGEFYDYYPGYGLVDENGVGFAVSSNSEHKLYPHNDTGFYKGTKKYYEITVNDDVEVELIDFNQKSTVKELTINYSKDLEYINNGDIYNFIFTDGKVTKINK